MIVDAIYSGCSEIARRIDRPTQNVTCDLLTSESR